MLTTIDHEVYTRDGYQELPDLLLAPDLRRATELLDDLDSAEHVVASYEPEYDSAEGVRRLRKLRRLLWNEPRAWSSLLNRSGIVDIAFQMIGRSASVIFHAAFLKPARIGTPVAPHQDQALWSRDYPKAFSVWIALSDVSPTNGGLFGCPGSHARGVITHRAHAAYPWHGSLDISQEGLNPPVQFRLKPGDAVMWDRFFVHGSAANRSAEDRRGMVVVFADAADSRFWAKDSFPLARLMEQRTT